MKSSFTRYRRSWLRGDLLAGVTVAAYLVPQVMAYAEVAGLPPEAGLWAVIGPLTVYAVLGSSKLLSVGPESTTALMTAVALGPLAAGDPARYGALAAVLARRSQRRTRHHGGRRLAGICDELRHRGITFALARVKLELREDLEAAGLLRLIGSGSLYPTLPSVVDAFRARGKAPAEPG
ncbi:SulP family inorganic anion transporter [Amycolatopsis sp. TRM77291]